MCPVCIAAAAMVVGKATTTSGLAFLSFKKLFPRKIGNQTPAPNPTKEVRNG